MVFGEKATFAIESEVSACFQDRSLLALGYFLIWIREKRFGVCSPDASLLACSLDAVELRLDSVGLHTTSFTGRSTESIASQYARLRYGEPGTVPATCECVEDDEAFLRELDNGDIVWVPDGDQAFDDGSHVLQFDCARDCIVMGFRQLSAGTVDFTSFASITIPSADYYDVLSRWREWIIDTVAASVDY